MYSVACRLVLLPRTGELSTSAARRTGCCHRTAKSLLKNLLAQRKPPCPRPCLLCRVTPKPKCLKWGTNGLSLASVWETPAVIPAPQLRTGPCETSVTPARPSSLPAAQASSPTYSTDVASESPPQKTSAHRDISTSEPVFLKPNLIWQTQSPGYIQLFTDSLLNPCSWRKTRKRANSSHVTSVLTKPRMGP